MSSFCFRFRTNNKILRNNITNVFLASPCQLYENNFFLSDKPDLIVSNIWDNGSVGNYWNNYALRYLNATEIENSGIGNTSYIIEKGDYSTRAYPNVANIDYHPLFYPYDIEHETISFPTPSSTIPELPWLAIVPLLLSLFTVALVLMHRKKR